jgi:CheY-like chemotaxis protein
VSVAPERKRILVVDDDLWPRRQVVEMCEEWGYEVAEAGTAEQGVALIPVFRPDLVVCDLTMGRAHAYPEGVGRLREAVGPAVPIVVNSGYCGPRYEEAARQAGACEYVCKPDPERLRALLQPRALTGRRSARA